MNVPTNYDDTVEAKRMHPDLLPIVEKVEAKFGRKILVRKIGMESNVVLSTKQVQTFSKKKIIWSSPLVQRRSVLGVDGINKFPESLDNSIS